MYKVHKYALSYVINLTGQNSTRKFEIFSLESVVGSMVSEDMTGQYKMDLMCDNVTEFITIVSNISPHHFNHS